MYDLDEFLHRNGHRWLPGATIRVALVSRSYRSTGARRGQTTKAFGSRFPPLGLLNLAAGIRQDAPVLRRQAQIAIFDEEDHPDLDALFRAVTTWLDAWDGPTMIGVTTYTHNIAELESFLARFGAVKHLIVAGGPHATVQPWLDHAHVLVRGEGRHALAHLVDALGTDDFDDGVVGTGMVLTRAGVTAKQRPAYDDSLRTLPSPPYAYDLTRASREFFKTHVERAVSARPQIFVGTQSCQARCSFCSTYLVHGPFKSRPADLIAQDLRYLVEVEGHDGFEFWDDDITQHEELSRLLAALADLGKPWFCFGRAENITPKLAADLAEAGCHRIFLGIESMRQHKLTYFGKGTTVTQNSAAVQALDEQGVGVIAGFILGVPGDTVESLLAEYRDYQTLPLLMVSPSILGPDPGTREYSRAKSRGGAFSHMIDEHGIRADTARYGTGAPVGLPPLSSGISKDDLNLLLDVVQGHFNVSQATWTRFQRDLPSDREEDLISYLRVLRERALRPAHPGCHPAITHLAAEVRGRILDWLP